MEGNKDEAERCTELAERYVREKRFDEAEKFLRKAQRLYPTKKAEGERDMIRSLLCLGSPGMGFFFGGGREREFVFSAKILVSLVARVLFFFGRKWGFGIGKLQSWEGPNVHKRVIPFVYIANNVLTDCVHVCVLFCWQIY